MIPENGRDDRHAKTIYTSDRIETTKKSNNQNTHRSFVTIATTQAISRRTANALRTMFIKKDLLPRIGRLDVRNRIQTRFEDEARDALTSNLIQLILEVTYVDITETDWITAAQLQEVQLVRIQKILAGRNLSGETKYIFKGYALKNEKLHRRLSDGDFAWVVPKDARLQIYRLCYDDAGATPKR